MSGPPPRGLDASPATDAPYRAGVSPGGEGGPGASFGPGEDVAPPADNAPGTCGAQAAHDSSHEPRAHADERPAPVVFRALALTASNRAAAGVYRDTGGPLIVAGLRAMGFATDGPRVVADGDPVGVALRAAVSDGYDVVVTTGGTGLSPTDRTPEMTRQVIDHEVPGIAEAIRAAGREAVPTAALSRGVAGVAGRTLVVNLPGSSGGVRDGLAVLEPLLWHAAEQLHGGDHPRGPEPKRLTEPKPEPAGPVATARAAAPAPPAGSGAAPSDVASSLAPGADTGPGASGRAAATDRRDGA